MHPWNRSIILAFSLILVLAVSAMAVQPALADDSTPPPPAPSTGSVPAAPTGNNLPAKVPAGTDVVVLDKSGNSVPLASQKAAQIVASGDPLWCPKGAAPRPGVGGCSPAFSGFTYHTPKDYGLSTWLSNNDPSKKLKAGAIWIAGNYQSSTDDSSMTDLTLTGATLTNMSNYSLDINGGWNGTPGSKTIVKTSPSVFNVSVNILYWNAPITISDIVVTGVTATNPNGSWALMVHNKGGITLNRVQVINNYGGMVAAGAHLYTTSATPGHLVPVTINDSVFSYNYGSGLYLQSEGAVKIRNLTADYNGDSTISGIGAYIINNGSFTPNQPVTLTGINEFKENYGSGLEIFSNGAVSLNNITAYNNDSNGSNAGGTGYGVYIVNNSDSTPYSTPSIVKLTGTNRLTRNAGEGLYIRSNGNVSLNNITASFNGGNGVLIRNDDNLLKAQSVTISGTNSFYGNTDDGLRIYSYGAIKLSNITTNDNGQGGSFGYGAYLDNQGYDANAGGTGIAGAAIITRAPVTLTGTNTFNNNYFNGLQVHSVGAISVSNITASNNGTVSSASGVILMNHYDWYPNFGAKTPYAANVTLNGFGTFENNSYDGIDIYSAGAVKLTALKANYNYENGANIATIGFLAPQSVTLTGVNILDNNANGSGLEIYNDGKITISNLDASNNGTDGAYLDNYTNSWLNKFQGVTLTGFNTFQQNQGSTSGSTYYYGLYIHTDGSVTMSHINADGNLSNGVYVTATRNVTITCGIAFHNSSDGFYLWSGTTTTGATITLIGVQSYYNGTNEIPLPVGVVVHRTASCP